MKFHLGLFFTRGVSLKTWDLVGNLDREIALYLRMIKAGTQVTFFTYGDSGDLKYLSQLNGIGICCNEMGLDLEEYESNLSQIHGKAFESLSIIKTNQTYGAEIALDVANKFKKPFIARCGYMWSQNCLREHGVDSPVTLEAFRVENKVFNRADGIVVTTETMRDDVLNRMRVIGAKLMVIPNYVDTDVFRPLKMARKRDTLVFVGRIAPEKNLESLFEAIRPLNVRLLIIGEGRLRPFLQEKYADLDRKLLWEGGVPNS
ncbi:MAG: glycosyltransferase family 4 protein, partial [Desulfomonilaceae bacterium]